MLCFLAYANGQTVQNEDVAGEAVICHYRGQGYIIKTPDDWMSNKRVASQNGFCGLYIPAGEQLSTASIVLYPMQVDFPEGTTGSAAIEAQVNFILSNFKSSPGSENLTAKKYEVVKAGNGEEFEIWLFDDGADVNAYEAVAYHANTESLFFLVMTSSTKKARDEALPLLKEMIESIQMLNLSMANK